MKRRAPRRRTGRELISRAIDVGFVVKPFKESALVEALHEALQQTPHSAALSYLGRPARD